MPTTPSKAELFLRERLKALREKSGLTQGIVSELAGISYDYYKDIEQGVRPNVSIRMIDQIAKAYGLSIHELFAPEVPTVKAKLKAVPSPHYKKRNLSDENMSDRDKGLQKHFAEERARLFPHLSKEVSKLQKHYAEEIARRNETKVKKSNNVQKSDAGSKK